MKYIKKKSNRTDRHKHNKTHNWQPHKNTTDRQKDEWTDGRTDMQHKSDKSTQRNERIDQTTKQPNSQTGH